MPLFAQNDSTNQRITLHKISASIIPPKHFIYDSITDKISHPGSLATIQINEVRNRNYKKITAAMTEKYMASQGFALIDKLETKMQNGDDAVIFRCKFKSHDDKGRELDFIRLLLFTGTESTIWITADFPECMGKLIERAITDCITSIQNN
ncbi:MAG: hypothetical protein IK025_04085 [Bacteroidales bacterium]|nr:hypothetical protein [Bacteroidales bacterium]